MPLSCYKLKIDGVVEGAKVPYQTLYAFSKGLLSNQLTPLLMCSTEASVGQIEQITVSPELATRVYQCGVLVLGSDAEGDLGSFVNPNPPKSRAKIQHSIPLLV